MSEAGPTHPDSDDGPRPSAPDGFEAAAAEFAADDAETMERIAELCGIAHEALDDIAGPLDPELFSPAAIEVVVHAERRMRFYARRVVMATLASVDLTALGSELAITVLRRTWALDRARRADLRREQQWLEALRREAEERNARTRALTKASTDRARASEVAALRELAAVTDSILGMQTMMDDLVGKMREANRSASWVIRIDSVVRAGRRVAVFMALRYGVFALTSFVLAQAADAGMGRLGLQGAAALIGAVAVAALAGAVSQTLVTPLLQRWFGERVGSAVINLVSNLFVIESEIADLKVTAIEQSAKRKP